VLIILLLLLRGNLLFDQSSPLTALRYTVLGICLKISPEADPLSGTIADPPQVNSTEPRAAAQAAQLANGL
jgi:hypothetical protein